MRKMMNDIDWSQFPDRIFEVGQIVRVEKIKVGQLISVHVSLFTKLFMELLNAFILECRKVNEEWYSIYIKEKK